MVHSKFAMSKFLEDLLFILGLLLEPVADFLWVKKLPARYYWQYANLRSFCMLFGDFLLCVALHVFGDFLLCVAFIATNDRYCAG